MAKSVDFGAEDHDQYTPPSSEEGEGAPGSYFYGVEL